MLQTLPLALLIAHVVTFSISAMAGDEKVGHGSPSEAFSVEPMEFEVSAVSVSEPMRMKLVNKAETASPIRISVFERSDSLDGSEQRKLSRDITVDAPEFILPAGSSREILMTYVGSGAVAKERAYRVVVKQVGDGEPDSAQAQSLDLRFVYVASVYIVPEKPKSKITIRKVKRISDFEIEIDLENEGNVHSLLRTFKPRILAKTAKGSRELKFAEESLQLLSKQNLLAGSRRRLQLRLRGDQKLSSGTVLKPIN